MLTAITHNDLGLITVDNVEKIEEFSTELLDIGGPFLQVNNGQIIVTAANGRWRFRPIGPGLVGKSVRAVLEKSEWFDLKGLGT